MHENSGALLPLEAIGRERRIEGGKRKRERERERKRERGGERERVHVPLNHVCFVLIG